MNNLLTALAKHQRRPVDLLDCPKKLDLLSDLVNPTDISGRYLRLNCWVNFSTKLWTMWFWEIWSCLFRWLGVLSCCKCMIEGGFLIVHFTNLNLFPRVSHQCSILCTGGWCSEPWPTVARQPVISFCRARLWLAFYELPRDAALCFCNIGLIHNRSGLIFTHPLSWLYRSNTPGISPFFECPELATWVWWNSGTYIMWWLG
jgi:hypothetical protein